MNQLDLSARLPSMADFPAKALAEAYREAAKHDFHNQSDMSRCTAICSYTQS